MANPKILLEGSVGPAVKQMQTLLKKWVPEAEITGKFTHETKLAVIKFQTMVGFKGKDVDGKVGPKTTLALAQLFDFKLVVDLVPNLTPPSVNAPVLNLRLPRSVDLSPSTKALETNVPAAAPKAAGSDDNIDSNAQIGVQYSKRDGPGIQYQFSGVFKSKGYLPNSAKNSFYHGLHLEVTPQATLGVPIPGLSSIYTGQIGFTIQPLTDWLVLNERWHLLTPTLGGFGQIPMNTPPGAGTGSADPATHSRLGFNLGAELFHVDFGKDGYALGISGQVSGYHDYTDRKFWWDPSVFLFFQGPLSK